MTACRQRAGAPAMKRAPALIPLSREHHEALVLARRACEPQRADPGPLRLHVLERWEAHFEPHFAIEETVLFPALEAAGAVAEAGEARSQHARLRELAARLRAGETAALPAWGDAMRNHVKWEERFLFPQAEQLLDLAPLGAALQRTEEDPCHP